MKGGETNKEVQHLQALQNVCIEPYRNKRIKRSVGSMRQDRKRSGHLLHSAVYRRSDGARDAPFYIQQRKEDSRWNQMSKKQYTVCDHEDCKNKVESSIPYLEDPGWMRILYLGDEYDVCPEHVKEILDLVGGME